MTLTFHGRTYRYRTAGEPEREIGVCRGLGGTWIVGYAGVAGHHRIKSPRLPAGPDPDALQAALDTWAAERGLQPAGSQGTPPAVADSHVGSQGSTPAPQAAARPNVGAGSTPRSTTATAGDGDAAAVPALPAAGASAVVRSTGESEGPRSLGGVRGSAPSVPVLASLPAIPDGWEAKAAMVDQCVAAGQRLSLWIAVIVTRARADFADPGEWVAACTERWGWAKAHLHHMHAVGSLLLRVSPGTLTILADLHWEKLYCISRLPENLLAPFLERAHPQDRSRDEVRQAVNRWLAAPGEPADEGAAEPAPRRLAAHQPDFLDVLFAAANDDARRTAMAADPAPARKTAVGGLVLLDVAVRKYAREDAPDLHDLETLLGDLEKQEATVREILHRAVRGGPSGALPAPTPTGEEF